MHKGIIRFFLSIVFSSLFVLVCFNIPYYEIVNTPNVINLTEQDLIDISNNKTFGKFINISNNSINKVSKTKDDAIEIVLKIFNMFPIKKIQAKVYDDSTILASGELIGFNIKTNGVIVEGINNILKFENNKIWL